MVKQILNIDDVFSKIKPEHTKQDAVLVNGQLIPLSRNLLILNQLGNLTCSVCGCNGTHLQQHFAKMHNGSCREVWRVMTWSNSHNKISFLNIDHIIPVSWGGPDTLENYRVTCHDCNAARGNTMDVPLPHPGITLSNVVDLIRDKFKTVSKLKSKIKVFVNSVRKRINDIFLDLTNGEVINTLIKCLTFIGIKVQANFFSKLIPA